MNDEYRELFIMYGNEDEHSKLKALRENFKFWQLRDEYEKIAGIKILIL